MLLLLQKSMAVEKNFWKHVQLFHYGEAVTINKQNTLKLNKPNKEHAVTNDTKVFENKKVFKIIHICTRMV